MVDVENYDYTQETGGVLKHQLDANDVADKIAMNLRGKFYNDKSGEYEKDKNVKPIINEKGISIITSILKGKISNNNQYSQLTEIQIKDIRRSTINDVWDMLVINMDDFEVEDIHVSVILNLIDDALLLFLSRTEQGGFLNFIKGLFNSNENYNENTKNESKGFSVFGGGNE